MCNDEIFTWAKKGVKREVSVQLVAIVVVVVVEEEEEEAFCAVVDDDSAAALLLLALGSIQMESP